MPTPKSGYTVSGLKVPSVTTILNRFKLSESLIEWAYRCGMQGKSYAEERDSAMAVGTCVHACIDLSIAGEPIPPTIAEDNNVRPDNIEEARNAFRAWLDWRRDKNPIFEETEVGLVSEKHLFGGTFDAVCLIGGKRVLMDWKTAKAIMGDFKLQCFAYTLLWVENRQTPIDAVGILRLDKKTGKYEEHIIEANSDEATKYTNAFLSLRASYEALKVAGLLYNQRKKSK